MIKGNLDFSLESIVLETVVLSTITTLSTTILRVLSTLLSKYLSYHNMSRGPLLGEAAVIAFRYDRFLSTTLLCPASPQRIDSSEIAHIVHLLSAVGKRFQYVPVHDYFTCQSLVPLAGRCQLCERGGRRRRRRRRGI
jgi:hypothetical protein